MTTQAMSPGHAPRRSLVTRNIVQEALVASLVKLLPQHQWRNPVMFVVYVGSILTTILLCRHSADRARRRRTSSWQ